MADVVLGQLNHTRSLVGLLNDQPDCFQLLQRFADGNVAHLELTRQHVSVDAFARRDGTCHDGFFHMLENAI